MSFSFGRLSPLLSELNTMTSGILDIKINQHKIATHQHKHKSTTRQPWIVQTTEAQLALFPGHHAQLLLLAVRKVGEGLEGFITWCVPLLTSCTVASHDRSSSNRPRRTNWTVIMNWIQGMRSEGERTNPDVSRLNINPSRPSHAFRTASDKSWAWRPGSKARLSYVQWTCIEALHAASGSQYNLSHLW